MNRRSVTADSDIHMAQTKSEGTGTIEALDGQPLIQVLDLKKIYRVGEVEVPALRGVSIEVDKGEFCRRRGPVGIG